MKLLGLLMVWGALAAGALAAATGYLAALDADDQRLLGLTLAAPAGLVQQPDETFEPIAEKDQQLSQRLLLQLREAGVRNIRVKEFDFRRWRGRWYFAASLVVLLLGGRLTRRSSKAKVIAESESGRVASPEQTLQSIAEALEQLRSELPGMADPQTQMELIVQRVDELQKTQMTAFVDAREVIVASLGLAGYAGLMDAYAVAERQINRAWSAAADLAYEEAFVCLEEASTLIGEARRKL